jgi:DNA-binding transcriptional regulator YhcF (GntR family)
MSFLDTISVDKSSQIPLREQLLRQLTAGIRCGLLEPGHVLPPIVTLAERLGVAPGTVRDTYLQLGYAGLARGDGHAGTKVRDVALFHPRLIEAANQLAEVAQRLDLSLEDAAAALVGRWQRAALATTQAQPAAAGVAAAPAPSPQPVDAADDDFS